MSEAIEHITEALDGFILDDKISNRVNSIEDPLS